MLAEVMFSHRLGHACVWHTNDRVMNHESWSNGLCTKERLSDHSSVVIIPDLSYQSRHIVWLRPSNLVLLWTLSPKIKLELTIYTFLRSKELDLPITIWNWPTDSRNWDFEFDSESVKCISTGWSQIFAAEKFSNWWCHYAIQYAFKSHWRLDFFVWSPKFGCSTSLSDFNIHCTCVHPVLWSQFVPWIINDKLWLINERNEITSEPD